MTAAPEPPAGGHLTVVAGPSGAGKGTVIAEVLRRHPEVWLSVSATTRKPRPGEVDGVSYHFVDDDAFAAAVARGEYLEHATYAGHSYGTPAQPVRERLAAGVPCLLEIDLQGARQVRATLGSLARLVFLAPPSAEELERRLTARGTEDPAALARRLARAREEMKAEGEFDAVVVNGDVGEAATWLAAQLLDSAGRP